MFRKTIHAAAALAIVAALGACTSVETENRLSVLEEKVNRALQASAAAKVDAATAMMMAEEK
jgi:hypothetical protein